MFVAVHMQRNGVNAGTPDHQQMVVKAKMPFQFGADHIQWLDRSST
jgi:hypothetical protein